MLLVGYCFGIRSERRLCEEVHLNLAYRWFCRLDLSDPVPNHSAFSKNRHGRFRDSKLLRHLFEKTVARCIADGLVSGQRLAADVSGLLARFLFLDHRNELFVRKSCLHLSDLFLGGLHTNLEAFWGLRSEPVRENEKAEKIS
ncbi:hypothetical protein OCA8868_00370 [Octadecabacter ascidiaceicola]|uniref:Transposase InsH N-terminal domain-containing protein n=1 Tax=Octadecabacter ascidiaceicola TaxID=1655543 RepID=A0A238JNU9_9RHOB|nr:hypothetical protein OCA8868_00370 [Octadecabacter ascidiaceicola]